MTRTRMLPLRCSTQIRTYVSTTRQKHTETLRLPAQNPSLLPLVLSASNLLISRGPHTDSDPSVVYRISTRFGDNDGCSPMEEAVTPFFVSSPSALRRPIGFLRPTVLSELRAISETYPKSPWQIHYGASRAPKPTLSGVSFAPWVNEGGFSLRSSVMNELASKWRSLGLFSTPGPLGGWSDEQYPVYHPDRDSKAQSESTVAFTIERAALPVFGFANYGCLLTAYFQCRKTGETRIWIPRRSLAKKTWPGCLDVTVGGGIGFGETPTSTIIRECAEEASLDSNFVAQNIRSAGVLSFPNRSPAGWILPGLYYLFDLPLLADGTPVPRINKNDGEVESFESLGVGEVLDNLLAGKFKPSSALALVDFLIRHGYITEASDPRYVDVCLMLRRNLVLPVPW